MDVEGQVGPGMYADGVTQPFRIGKLGDGIANSLHGPYYEQTYRGNVFSYCSQAAAALSVFPAIGPTAGQLVLSNNNGSGKNLVILGVGVGTTSAATTTSVIGLVGGWSATNVVHTTPVSPVSNFIGQPAGVAKIDTAATLPTTVPAGPTMLLPILSQGISAINPNMSFVDIGGSIILPPGGFATFQTVGATPATAICAISWEEVAI